MGLDTVLLKTAFGLGAVGGLLLVTTSLEKAVENIVLVGGNNELVDGETHTKGEVTSENVAKVSGRNSEADLVAELEGRGLLAEEGEIGVEVVDSLGENTSPVDAVDGAELVGRVDLRVGKKSLDDVLFSVCKYLNDRREHITAHLAVVKVASDSQVMNIGVQHRGHLLLLDGAHAPLGVEHENRDVLLPPETVNGSRASITARGTHHGQVVSVTAGLSLVSAHQEILEEVSEELEGHILESKGWAVEKLEKMNITLEVH